MTKKRTDIPTYHQSVQQLFTDIEEGNVRVYPCSGLPPRIIQPRYLDKCTEVWVGITGADDARYAIVMGRRVDEDKKTKEKEIDIDPIAFLMDSDSGGIFPSGVWMQDRDFDGRTTDLPGFQHYTCDQTVKDLRATLRTGEYSTADVPQPLRNAMVYGVAKFQTYYGQYIPEWLNPASGAGAS